MEKRQKRRVVGSASVARNLEQVRRRIEEAAVRVGRDPDEVTLVAISKLFPLEKIQEAYEAGIKQFGENRVYEAAEKIPQVKGWIQEER
ncbi:MAG: hypothetical protein U9Q78_05485, partial [Chloroflexota bacterium]|nr:hypothetical protein [Chloroflexota bacterium]